MQPLKHSVKPRSRLERWLPGWLESWISIGIVAADEEVRRRQRFVNLGVYAAVLNNIGHTAYNSWYDFDGLIQINIYNLFVTLLIVLTPLWNRVGEVAGAAYLVGLVVVGNFYVLMMVGTSGGSLAYYTLAGAMFVLFGVRHWRIYVFFVAVGALVIILSTAFAPTDGPVLPGDAEFRKNFAGQILLNVLILNSVLVVYAVWALWRAEQHIASEHERSSSLIALTLPQRIAERLRAQPGRRIADGYDNLTIMAAQLDGFAQATKAFGPRETVDYLDRLHSDFDRLVDRFGVDKVRAVGEHYLVAGGLDGEAQLGAVAIGGLALEMLESMSIRARATGKSVGLRIGIHTGPAVAGVIGRQRLSFDVWGEAVDGAQNLAAECKPDAVHVARSFSELSDHVLDFAETNESTTGATYLTGLLPVEEPDFAGLADDPDDFLKDG